MPRKRYLLTAGFLLGTYWLGTLEVEPIKPIPTDDTRPVMDTSRRLVDYDWEKDRYIYEGDYDSLRKHPFRSTFISIQEYDAIPNRINPSLEPGFKEPGYYIDLDNIENP
jgi:hypothetical protein